MSKIITAEKAAALIQDNVTIGAATMGFAGWPEEVAIAIEARFKETGYPRNITMIHSSACGDYKLGGTQRIAYEGLIKRLICAHTGPSSSMMKLIEEDKIEAYILPQGVICHLWRAIAGKKPGVITKVGLGTFVDPRLEGGKVTASAKEDLVKVMEIDGEEWLHYKGTQIDVALIRGTVADVNGNLTMDKEAMLMEVLPLATAVRNSGGIVIAQVERIAQANTLNPKQIKVPGVLVDYIVVAKEKENHMQTQATLFNPALSGDIKIPMEGVATMALDERKIVARRAAMELRPKTVVNLGVGIPAGVAAIASEEGVSDVMTLTTESGIFGGIPAGGLDFGAAYNAEAMIEHHAMFDFYDGGGLDVAFLGLAQADQDGNTNVSKFGTRVVGCGGFINITQNAKAVVFCGTFMVGAEYTVADGKLHILKEGKGRKFLGAVDQITFSGKYAKEIGQSVLFVTERAVFSLIDGRLTLVEIAPGMALEKDILANMSFRPVISENLKLMNEGIFRESWGELKQIINRQSPVVELIGLNQAQ